MTSTPSVTLHESVQMPAHGLGVFQTEDGREVEQAIGWAFEAGYRMIDTASIYGNEVGVGNAIAASGLARDDVFVTTKLWNDDQGHDATLAACRASLERLGLDHVDLYLIHWPRASLMGETWKAMERLREEGLTRAIGVSNFLPHHLDQLASTSNVAPALNQVELHPHLQQPELVQQCRDQGIAVQSWSPLKRGRLLDDPTLSAIADAHGVTTSQVILRWQLQEGWCVIPKSVHQDRITANRDLFGFTLTGSEMDQIRGMDRAERIGPDPDGFPGD